MQSQELATLPDLWSKCIFPYIHEPKDPGAKGRTTILSRKGWYEGLEELCFQSTIHFSPTDVKNITECTTANSCTHVKLTMLQAFECLKFISSHPTKSEWTHLSSAELQFKCHFDWSLTSWQAPPLVMHAAPCSTDVPSQPPRLQGLWQPGCLYDLGQSAWSLSASVLPCWGKLILPPYHIAELGEYTD